MIHLELSAKITQVSVHSLTIVKIIHHFIFSFLYKKVWTVVLKVLFVWLVVQQKPREESSIVIMENGPQCVHWVVTQAAWYAMKWDMKKVLYTCNHCTPGYHWFTCYMYTLYESRINMYYSIIRWVCFAGSLVISDERYGRLSGYSKFQSLSCSIGSDTSLSQCSVSQRSCSQGATTCSTQYGLKCFGMFVVVYTVKHEF